MTSIDNFVSIIAKAVVAAARQHEMPLPRLMLEPGRSIIGRAGVTLYSVLATKQLPADDTAGRYLHVDGGMGDNIRPALYGAHYTLAWPARMSAPRTEHVHIAGRYCESGDVLLRDVPAPADAAAGTVVAIAATGAYTLSMASTYNMVPRPPVVFVSQGRALLAQRRETYADLLKRDLNEPEDGAAAVA